MSKYLVVSCHLSGGCFQYSNEIISRLKLPADVYVPKKVAEPSILTNTKTFLLWGYPTILRFLSLLWLLIKIVFLGIMGYYKSLILFGYAGWDYFIMKAWKLTGKKTYFVVHDGKMHCGESDELNQRRILYIMRNASNLIFLSDYVRNLVKDNFNIQKPSHIAPHGLIDYGPIEQKGQRKLPTLLFIGRVTKYKGIDVLLEAIDKIDNSVYEKIIIAGKWDSDMAIPESSSKVEIVNRFLTSGEIMEFMATSDVMLFPYLEATQSGVASLALNYMKPSIVTDVGAFKEQFTNKSAIFIEPNDVNALAQAIERLSKDLVLRNEMVEAIKVEREQFKWLPITENLENYILNNESTNS